ncbi:MAG: phosphoglucosamine mutase [Myxococcota bacterium]
MTTIGFGTDGIRGRAGTHPITESVAVRVGRAAIRLAQATGGRRVVVGHDTRPSSPDLARAAGAGITSAGGVWLAAGVVPTSAVGLAIDSGIADVGIMVTASHNPAHDNGFKIVGSRGRKLDEAASRAVEAWIAETPPEVDGGAPNENVGRAVLDEWRRTVRRTMPSAQAFAGKRIAFDFANGAAAGAGNWLGDDWPAEIHIVKAPGAINEGCGSEHLHTLQAAVVEHQCDGGIALDGDGDRCRIVDERGALVPGDAVLWSLATEMQVSGLVVTVMSNGGLEPALPGVRVVRTAVGDRFVREQMDALSIPLGGEESGHVLFGDVAAGDGLVTGLRTLGLAWATHDTLSEAFAGFKPLPRSVAKVPVAQRPPLAEIAPLQEARAAAADRLGPHGRVFLRYSGTEPVLRILVEGQDQAGVDAVLVEVERIARDVLS